MWRAAPGLSKLCRRSGRLRWRPLPRRPSQRPLQPMQLPLTLARPLMQTLALPLVLAQRLSFTASRRIVSPAGCGHLSTRSGATWQACPVSGMSRRNVRPSDATPRNRALSHASRPGPQHRTPPTHTTPSIVCQPQTLGPQRRSRGDERGEGWRRAGGAGGRADGPHRRGLRERLSGAPPGRRGPDKVRSVGTGPAEGALWAGASGETADPLDARESDNGGRKEGSGSADPDDRRTGRATGFPGAGDTADGKALARAEDDGARGGLSAGAAAGPAAGAAAGAGAAVDGVEAD